MQHNDFSKPTNWSNNLGDVKSQKIQSLVRQLSKVVDIKHVLPEDYNEDSQAGCEVVFAGKQPGLVGYEPGMDVSSLVALGKMLQSVKSSIECQLLGKDDGDLTLIILGEADA